MKSYDVLSNLDEIFPYYQPIINADQHRILGYEVLARMNYNGKVISLGPIFNNPEIPIQTKSILDNHIQKKALEFAVTLQEKPMFFLNRNAEALMKDEGDRFYKILLDVIENGLSPKQIVLEITEHDFRGAISDLKKLLTRFRELGVQVAIDDVGKGASNLDRISILEPEILKVDIHALKPDEMTSAYHGIIYSLSILSRKIGASLLFEGIENVHLLKYAWGNGGRYYQGFLLGYPSAELVTNELPDQPFQDKLLTFINDQKTKLLGQHSLTRTLNERVGTLIHRTKDIFDLDDRILKVASDIEDISMRLYVCDENGFQKTSNITRNQKGKWEVEAEYKGRNWSWRPYFLENIVKMSIEEKGILSDLYNDVETGQLMRTLSYPLDEGLYLFIDIPLSFIEK